MTQMTNPEWGDRPQTGHQHCCCHGHPAARDTVGAGIARYTGSQPVMTFTEQATIAGWLYLGGAIGINVIGMGAGLALATKLGVPEDSDAWVNLIMAVWFGTVFAAVAAYWYIRRK